MHTRSLPGQHAEFHLHRRNVCRPHGNRARRVPQGEQPLSVAPNKCSALSVQCGVQAQCSTRVGVAGAVRISSTYAPPAKEPLVVGIEWCAMRTVRENPPPPQSMNIDAARERRGPLETPRWRDVPPDTTRVRRMRRCVPMISSAQPKTLSCLRNMTWSGHAVGLPVRTV